MTIGLVTMVLILGLVALLIALGMLVGVVAVVAEEPRVLPGLLVILWVVWRVSRGPGSKVTRRRKRSS